MVVDLSRVRGTAGRATTDDASPERVAELSRALAGDLDRSLNEINDLNREVRLLALNARIEAGRAGGKIGAAFGVVAQAMNELSGRTARVAGELGQRSQLSIQELERVNNLLGTNFRGRRLSDIALTNIDLIDRNLYERSCDVRWWATDSSLVAALTDGTRSAAAFASRRLSVILDSYTVYRDLVLCDLNGRVIANGRPRQYESLGTDHANAAWFRAATATRTGAEFGFQSVHESPLTGGRALVYSCAIRSGGDATGTPLGVLGIVFDWDALGQTVVERCPLTDDERARTRVCITDETGLILADTEGRQLAEKLLLPQLDELFEEAQGFRIVTLSDDRRLCIAHARAPGFETYSTGWHSVLVCRL